MLSPPYFLHIISNKNNKQQTTKSVCKHYALNRALHSSASNTWCHFLVIGRSIFPTINNKPPNYLFTATGLACPYILPKRRQKKISLIYPAFPAYYQLLNYRVLSLSMSLVRGCRGWKADILEKIGRIRSLQVALIFWHPGPPTMHHQPAWIPTFWITGSCLSYNAVWPACCTEDGLFPKA